MSVKREPPYWPAEAGCTSTTRRGSPGCSTSWGPPTCRWSSIQSSVAAGGSPSRAASPSSCPQRVAGRWRTAASTSSRTASPRSPSRTRYSSPGMRPDDGVRAGLPDPAGLLQRDLGARPAHSRRPGADRECRWEGPGGPDGSWARRNREHLPLRPPDLRGVDPLYLVMGGVSPDRAPLRAHHRRPVRGTG